MKRTLVLLLVLAIALAGCTKTPAVAVVGQKDMDRLVERAKADPDGNALSDIAAGTPADYVWSTNAYDGRVTVEVNAAVTLPDVKGMPTYQVSAGEFSQEQVDGMVAYLYGDKTIYDTTTGEIMVKADYQRDIDRLESILDAGPEDPRWLIEAAYYDEEDGTGENLSEEYIRFELESRLEWWKMLQESAPERIQDSLAVSDGKLAPSSTGDGSGLSVIDEARNQLSIGSQEKTSSTASHVWFYRNPIPGYNLNNAVPGEGCKGYGEAKALADGFFEACGTEMALLSAYQVDNGVPEDGTFISLKNYIPLSADPQEATQTAFVFYYTSAAGGMPVAYDPDGGYTGPDKFSTEFNAMWTYEFAYIVVDDEGICEIRWAYPLTERDQVTDNTGLISFEDAKVIFEEMITVPYEGELAAIDALQVEGVEDNAYDLQIDTVCLSLIRTRSTGGERTGILTPAWVFYGSIGGTGSQGMIQSLFPRIVFAINAIDGTMIDVLRGY